MKIISSDPFICVIDDFLTENECDELVAMAQKKGMSPSIVGEAKEIKPETRSSKTTFFNVAENDIVNQIEKKVKILTQIPIDHGEKLQVSHYPTGGFFNQHYDFPKALLHPQNLYPFKQERIITVLIYLNTVEEGGETVFPKLKFAVIPQKGRALLWYNCKKMGLPSSDQKDLWNIPTNLNYSDLVLHGGKPVLSGEKWIATKWISSFPLKSGIRERIPDLYLNSTSAEI